MIKFGHKVITDKRDAHLNYMIKSAKLKGKKREISAYSYVAGFIACLKFLADNFNIDVVVETEE